MSSAEALTALGADLTFSISFQIASELRLAAVATGVSDLELISIVLIVSIALAAGPSSLHRGKAVFRQMWLHQRPGRLVRNPWLSAIADALLGRGKATADRASPSVFEFVELLVGIARRISMSLLVQLVAAAAVARQTRRYSRILSLFGVAIFFLFLQSGASTVAQRRTNG